MKQISEQQLLELFGGIGAPRKSFKRMNIPISKWAILDSQNIWTRWK